MAVSTRRSSSGSASGGGSGRCSGRRGLTRRTSSTRSEGGLSAATDIGPPGAATTATRLRRAANSARVPAGDHSPNRATARAWPGSSPRPASEPSDGGARGHGPEDGGGGVGFGAERAVVLGPAGQHGELAALAAVGVDHGEHVARVEFHRGDGAGVHPVPFQGRVGGQQPRHEQARPFRGHRHREITVISISPADRIPVVDPQARHKSALHPAEITPDTCPAEGDRGPAPAVAAQKACVV